MTDTTENPGRWSRKMRFRLSSLLLLMTVCSLFMGIWSVYVQPYREQAKAMTLVSDCQGIMTNQPAQGSDLQRWLVTQVLGEDRFTQIVFVDLRSAQPSTEVLRALGKLRFLRSLYLDRTNTDDAVVANLLQLKQLEELSLSYTPISDKGIKQLENHRQLTTLYLTGTAVTDECIHSLQKLHSLKELYVRWTTITPRGTKKLREVLPACQIHSHQLENRQIN